MGFKTATNTSKMELRVREAAREHPGLGGHDDLDPHFEHGQWWVCCPGCGTQWSVVDATGGASVDGFDFDQVTEGDESCRGFRGIRYRCSKAEAPDARDGD